MKPIKTLGLGALLALAVLAVAGPNSAAAESTTLCAQDGAACGVTHIHLTGRRRIKMFNKYYICDVLFLGTIHGGGLASPLTKLGFSIARNCSPACTVEEENGPSEITLLKEGHETASVTEEFLIHVECEGFIDCFFNGVGLKGTAKGPLLSVEENGELTIPEQTLNKETGGFLCPTATKTELVTTPLTPIYISS